MCALNHHALLPHGFEACQRVLRAWSSPITAEPLKPKSKSRGSQALAKARGGRDRGLAVCGGSRARYAEAKAKG